MKSDRGRPGSYRENEGGRAMSESPSVLPIDTDDITIIRDPEEILTDPRHLANIDPQVHRPVKILAHYKLPGRIPCALPDRTLHGKGWVFELADGSNTNVGHCCAQAKYGVSEADIAQATRMVELRELRDKLTALVASRHSIYKRIDALMEQPHGGHWLISSLKSFNSIYPADICTEVRARAFRRETAVTRVRTRSKEERDAYRAALAGASHAPLRASKGEQYEDVLMGQLQGLAAFEPGVRKHSIFTIKERLESLALVSIYSENAFHLSTHHNAVKNIDEEINDFGRRVEAGRVFFRANNLALLPYLTHNTRVARATEQVIWEYDAGQPQRHDS